MRRTGPTRTIGMVGAVVALVAVAGLTGCRTEPSSLQVTTVLSGLGRPWDLAFSPGGSLFFTERAGKIRIRTTSGEVRTLAQPADVAAVGEGGMLGIAIDPDFSSNRRIYTCFRSTAGGAADIRLVRWRVNNATTALGSRADIVTGMPTNSSGRHSGCRPRFGPDGSIWMGTGDAATSSVPQNPKSLGGKVLRIDTDGKGVAGNASAPFDNRIYTYGHRNVQGIAFSPGGKAYAIEHGTDRDDEVNRLVAGANYGWDPRPPGGGTGYDESQPMTNLTKYPNARKAVWSSGNPTIAPSGGTFLKGSKWGGWERSLAMAVLKDQHLRVLAFNQDGTAVDQQWTRITDRGRLRVAVLGPDGNLYIAVDNDPGTIFKITPTA
ncbi:MAG: putative secreted protein [Ilumatobacteraceae bacterium]|nr:putative secreted protein [Ilumatobacteraceae bacterium]